MALDQKQRSRIVHQHLAADRLRQQGESNEEISEHLRKTTHEQRVQANNAWAEQKGKA